MAWKKFWFEGNRYFGLVDSPEKWEDLKETYKDNFCEDLKGLFSAKRDESSDTDKFGFRSECRGRETLGEFFKKNGMIVTTSKMKFIDWCKENDNST
ncbi:MAG TPA: hypothetical protein VMV43_05920 [Candidatus Nanopelagicaceae bacterium]|nr:hypothetical protein [Candidatus Nanopelagicaceae bacterium]